MQPADTPTPEQPQAESELLGRVVHDLRGPLRALTSYARKLPGQCGEQLSSQGSDGLTRLLNAVTRMQTLLDDLAAFARAGRSGSFADVDCGAVFAEVCAALQPAITACSGQVSAGELPRVRGDRAQLVQLLHNLLDNALKFRSERAPVVRVEARRQGDDWLFTVTDNGIGIEPQYLRDIFGFGMRLNSPSQYPGSGYGLTACERIVQRQGGRIRAESPGLDQGTTISFTLADQNP
jgi:light-regulated signal transduction histidine kinase (bacteriophytochrome)